MKTNRSCKDCEFEMVRVIERRLGGQRISWRKGKKIKVCKNCQRPTK